MIGWSDFEVWKQRHGEFLREAQERALAREARKVRESFAPVEGGAVAGRIEVRWGRSEDEVGIAELLSLNGMPRWIAFEERFIVAERGGKLRAALRYRTESKRLVLGLLVVDPWAGERRFARALYMGVRDLGREMGVVEILASKVPHVDYPGEAGYRKRGGGWRVDATRPVKASEEPDEHPSSKTTFATALLRRLGWR